MSQHRKWPWTWLRFLILKIAPQLNMPVRRPSRVWPTDNTWVMISILSTLLCWNALKFSFPWGYEMCVYKSETRVWCLLQSLLTLVLRRGLQLRLEIDDSATLAGQQVLPQGYSGLCLPSARVTGMYRCTWLSCGCWELNSSCHACFPSTWPSEPFHIMFAQHISFFLKNQALFFL